VGIAVTCRSSRFGRDFIDQIIGVHIDLDRPLPRQDDQAASERWVVTYSLHSLGSLAEDVANFKFELGWDNAVK